MIQTPYLDDYWVGERLQFLENVVEIGLKYQPQLLKFDGPLAILQEALVPLRASFAKTKGSEKTPEVESNDLRRDNCATGLHLVLEGFTYYFDPKISGAAKILLNSMDSLGTNIARLNLQLETSTLTKLTQAWTTDENLVAALQTLNLTDWVKETQSANEAFNASYLSRVESNAAKPTKTSKEESITAVASYRTLVKDIDALNTLAKNDTYTALIGELNELVNKYNLTATNRMAYNKKKATEAAAAKTT